MDKVKNPIYPDDEIQLPSGEWEVGLDPATGKFTDGDPETGLLPSRLPSSHLNLLTDLIADLIVNFSGEVNNSDATQLTTAITTKINEVLQGITPKGSVTRFADLPPSALQPTPPVDRDAWFVEADATMWFWDNGAWVVYFKFEVDGSTIRLLANEEIDKRLEKNGGIITTENNKYFSSKRASDLFLAKASYIVPNPQYGYFHIQSSQANSGGFIIWTTVDAESVGVYITNSSTSTTENPGAFVKVKVAGLYEVICTATHESSKHNISPRLYKNGIIVPYVGGYVNDQVNGGNTAMHCIVKLNPGDGINVDNILRYGDYLQIQEAYTTQANITLKKIN